MGSLMRSGEYKNEMGRLAFDIITLVVNSIEDENTNEYIPTKEVQYLHSIYNKGDDSAIELAVDEDIILAAWESLANDYD